MCLHKLCENIIYMIVDFIGADITAAVVLLILFDLFYHKKINSTGTLEWLYIFI